jgi:hypothetical protein
MNTSPTVVRDDHQLTDYWRGLIAPITLGSRQLFAIVIRGDGHVAPSIINVAPVPAMPDRQKVASLARLLDDLVADTAPDGGCAMLWARPAGVAEPAADVQWAQCLYQAIEGIRGTRWPIHVADDKQVQAVSPDGVAA